MNCPKCGTRVQIGDRFCEECGAALIAEPATPNLTGGCEKCGARIEAIDAEGYCSHCGFRNQMRENDRIEVTCSPQLAGVSDKGLKRDQNQDYLTCAALLGKNTYALVVCDGVCSAQEPQLAAKVAAESACRALTAALETGTMNQEEAMKAAFTSVLSAVCAIPYTKGIDADPPSTTIVAAIIENHTATIGWLGDSRAYWISPQGSRQLTRDDSWLDDMVASGQMTHAQAKKSDKAHAITRWLGVDAINDSEPSIVNFNIPSSGYLLLCTDGLWNYTPEIAQIA